MAKFTKYKDKKTGLQKWQWSGSIGVDPITGKQKVSKKKGFNTKNDAQRDFETRRYELLHRKPQSNNDKLTVGELISIYESVQKDKVTDNTYVSFHNMFSRLIKLNILDPSVKVNMLTVLDCQNIFDKICEHYTAPMAYYRRLNALFNFGEKNELIQQNVFKRINHAYRDKRQSKRRFFTKDELKIFMAEAKKEKNKQWYIMFTLLARTGIRQGELRALYWADLDTDTQLLSIRRTVTKDENDKEIIGTTTKNQSSKRTIALDDFTFSILMEWKKTQQDIFTCLGIECLDDDKQLIFTQEKENKLCPNSGHYVMKRICDRMQLPYITLHGLRHTFTSLALESKVNIVDVSHTLGHSDVKMTTQIYDEMNNNRRYNVANQVGDFLGDFDEI